MKLLLLGWTEIAVIALLVLLLFGGKKIPELMKGMGQGVKSFKDGMNGNTDDNKSNNSQTADNSSKTHEQSSDNRGNDTQQGQQQ
jgi:sec-independent protein translocase protein TatA